MDGNWNIAEQRVKLTGAVRWYDPSKRYGFVSEDVTGQDILIHQNIIMNFGRSSITEGTELKFMVTETTKGLQVSEIFEWENASVARQELPESEDTSPFVPSRVKWFNAQKGYGFVNEFGSQEDVFVFIDTLRAGGFASLVAGEAVSTQISTNENRKYAVNIRPW